MSDVPNDSDYVIHPIHRKKVEKSEVADDPKKNIFKPIYRKDSENSQTANNRSTNNLPVSNDELLKHQQDNDQINIQQVKLSNLIPFKDNLFPLYSEEKLDILAQSIESNGLYSPIIIRKTDESDIYEILSGHNRVEAAKKIGLKIIPAIIKDIPDDKQAALVVTESNLIQRSKKDFSQSELAIVIHNHFVAIKNDPEFFSKLANEIGETFDTHPKQNERSRSKIGKLLGMSETEVTRYQHFYRLIPQLKIRLDNGSLVKRTAESLSFLTADEQEIIETILAEGIKMNMEQAEKIKKLSKNNDFSESAVRNILASVDKTSLSLPIKFKRDFRSIYFKNGESDEEIEDVILKALDRYFNNI